VIEFREWPKIARLNRDIVITEKIDGTNAAVIIEETDGLAVDRNETAFVEVDGVYYHVGAQSRKRLITPEDDNFGFARWVHDNTEALASTLGFGHHFGEWWGSGIQRGYGLQKGEKRFSLFNTKRWSKPDEVGDRSYSARYDNTLGVKGLFVVPVLYEGPFSQALIDYNLNFLRDNGSSAQLGFMRPEGIVVYHTAANQMFKVTLEGDEAPKSLAPHAA
jgi:hypothetical protein